MPSTRSYSRRVHGLDTKQDAQHAPAPVVGGSKGLTKPNEAPYPYLQDLILVCGHAVFVGTDHANAGDEKNWFLEEYQKADGQAVALLEHMRVGVELASKKQRRVAAVFGRRHAQKRGVRVGSGFVLAGIARAEMVGTRRGRGNVRRRVRARNQRQGQYPSVHGNTRAGFLGELAVLHRAVPRAYR